MKTSRDTPDREWFRNRVTPSKYLRLFFSAFTVSLQLLMSGCKGADDHLQYLDVYYFESSQPNAAPTFVYEFVTDTNIYWLYSGMVPELKDTTFKDLVTSIERVKTEAAAAHTEPNVVFTHVSDRDANGTEYDRDVHAILYPDSTHVDIQDPNFDAEKYPSLGSGIPRPPFADHDTIKVTKLGKIELHAKFVYVFKVDVNHKKAATGP